MRYSRQKICTDRLFTSNKKLLWEKVNFRGVVTNYVLLDTLLLYQCLWYWRGFLVLSGIINGIMGNWLLLCIIENFVGTIEYYSVHFPVSVSTEEENVSDNSSQDHIRIFFRLLTTYYRYVRLLALLKHLSHTSPLEWMASIPSTTRCSHAIFTYLNWRITKTRLYSISVIEN